MELALGTYFHCNQRKQEFRLFSSENIANFQLQEDIKMARHQGLSIANYVPQSRAIDRFRSQVMYKPSLYLGDKSNHFEGEGKPRTNQMISNPPLNRLNHFAMN